MSLDSDLTQGERVLGRMTRATERALISAYARALKDVRAILAGYHERYDVGGVLTYIEMAKYNRLRSLEKEISAQLKALGREVGKLTTGASGAAYSESYLRTAYALEREAQAKLGWTLLNPKTIEASVQNPISGMKLSERLAGNRTAIVAKIRSEITQGLIRGEGYGDMAKRFKKVLDGDAGKAIKVAQTEAHRVMQEGRLASMQFAEARGVKQQKTWVATLDERTREDHQALDGQTVPVDDYFEINGMKALAPGGFGIAAMDISCRCGIRSSIAGYEPTVRRARGEGVIPYQTYPEWKAGRSLVSPYQGPEPKAASVASLPLFTPAATLDEAFAVARKNFAEVALPGVSLKAMNEINRGTFAVRSLAPYGTSRLAWARGGRSWGRHTWGGDNSLAIVYRKGFVEVSAQRSLASQVAFQANRAKAIALRESQIADLARPLGVRQYSAEKLAMARAFKRWTFSADAAGDQALFAVAVHEEAHGVLITQRLKQTWKDALYKHKATSLDYCALGQYAATTNEGEVFCEVFAGVVLGREKDIPEALLKAFYETMSYVKR